MKQKHRLDFSALSVATFRVLGNEGDGPGLPSDSTGPSCYDQCGPGWATTGPTDVTASC